MADKKITPDRLATGRTLILNYLQECYDHLPLHPHEQALALAAAGLVPSIQAAHYASADDPVKAQGAWLLATAWFLKLIHPKPLRRAGGELYKFLDELEFENPGAWAQTHNDVVGVIRDAGYELSDIRNR